MSFNRWYMPGETGKETMPADLPLKQSPDFKGRFIMGGACGEYNRYGGLSVPGGQVWSYLVPADTYFLDHPEYYSLVNGQRIPASPHSGQLCTTNPEVVRIVAKAACDWFRDNPEGVFPVSPADNGDFCECPNCTALDPLPGQITDRILVFLNQVAALVAKEFPDRKMGFLAYQNYTLPPVRGKVAPNLIPQICRIAPYGYGISEEHLTTLVKGWCALSDTVATYDYVGHYSWFGFAPNWREVARDFRLYRDLGVDVITAESHPHWATQGLNVWMAQVLAWDCDLDVDMLVDDYCKGMFHNAAPEMREFYRILDDESWRLHIDATYTADNFFTSRLIGELQSKLMEAAWAARGDEKAEERLALVYAGMRFTEHWANGYRWHERWVEKKRKSSLKRAADEWQKALDIAEGIGDEGFRIELVRDRLTRMIEKAR